MLPFLMPEKRKDTGMIVVDRRPDEEAAKDTPEDLTGIEVAMEEFCAAVDKKDFKGMAKAFKAAFEMLESMPHDEAPHEEQE